MIEYKMNPDLVCLKPDWQGNIIRNGKYQNDTVPESAPFLDVIKWKISRNPQKKEKRNENFCLKTASIDTLTAHDQIIWLGHATFLIQIDGVRIITDPVFDNIPATKREVDIPCDPNILTDIDYLLLSHDHHDHFSQKSIKQLYQNNPSLHALAPLGVKRLFNNKHLKNIPIQEAGWYQEYQLNNDIRIVCLPARHWGRRSLNDFNKVLWGSFLIMTEETKVFFAGDSAYGNIFKEINDLFGDIDICILPIGAYSPDFIMASSHMNPEEAIKAFNDLGGKVFLPMHYGTFDLSDEPLGEPIKRLWFSAQENNFTSSIRELMLGEKYLIKSEPNGTK